MCTRGLEREKETQPSLSSLFSQCLLSCTRREKGTKRARARSRGENEMICFKRTRAYLWSLQMNQHTWVLLCTFKSYSYLRTCTYISLSSIFCFIFLARQKEFGDGLLTYLQSCAGSLQEQDQEGIKSRQRRASFFFFLFDPLFKRKTKALYFGVHIKRQVRSILQRHAPSLMYCVVPRCPPQSFKYASSLGFWEPAKQQCCNASSHRWRT